MEMEEMENNELDAMIRAELLKNPDAAGMEIENMEMDEVDSEYRRLMGDFNESIWGLESFTENLLENLASCREQIAEMKTEISELQKRNQLLLSQLPAQ